MLPLLLLLFALSTVFLFRNDRSHFYRGPHHAHLSSQSMALAANLSPDHHFLMFFRQTLGVDGTRGYEPYNRFPIGTYALIKLSTLPFADSLAKQIYAARALMLVCFSATAVLAYQALCRLVSNRWVALAAILLAFSSTYCLYYNDMISTEITSLFGVLLTFHGMIVFVQDKRFIQLLVKTCLALLLGWYVYSLLLPFIIFGLVVGVKHKKTSTTISSTITSIVTSRHHLLGFTALSLSASVIISTNLTWVLYTDDGQSLAHFLQTIILIKTFSCFVFMAVGMIRKRFRESIYMLINERYLLLGISCFIFGIFVLLFNLVNEYFSLEGKSTLTELPTFQSMLWRMGLASPEHYTGWGNRLDWFPYLQGWLSRIGVASIPFFLPGYTSVFEVGYGQASNGTLSIIIGAGVFGTGLIGLAFARHKFLLAVLVLSGLAWGLVMRHSSYVHDFESLFYIGIPLTCFSLVLLYIQRLSSNRLLVGLAAAALIIFILSSFQMGRIGRGPEAAAFHERLIADFESIRRMTGGKRVLVLASERDTPFLWGHHAVNYYLAGSIIGYERDGYRLADYDFIITSERGEGGSLLTPENWYIFLYEITAPRG